MNKPAVARVRIFSIRLGFSSEADNQTSAGQLFKQIASSLTGDGGRVPHISLVFRGKWDTTVRDGDFAGVIRSEARDLQFRGRSWKCGREICGFLSGLNPQNR